MYKSSQTTYIKLLTYNVFLESNDKKVIDIIKQLFVLNNLCSEHRLEIKDRIAIYV